MSDLARKAQRHLTSSGMGMLGQGSQAQPSLRQRKETTGCLLPAVPVGTDPARDCQGMGKRTQQTHSLGQIKAFALIYTPSPTTPPFLIALTLPIQSFPGWPEGLTHPSLTSLLQIQVSSLRKHPMLQ